MSTSGINAGQLKRVVSILTPTVSKDSVGGILNIFDQLDEVAAMVEMKSGSEVDTLTKETAITKVNFTISKRTDFDKRAKINYRNKVYNILSILPVYEPRGLFLELVTEQIEVISGDEAGAEQAESKWIDNEGNTWIWN